MYLLYLVLGQDTGLYIPIPVTNTLYGHRNQNRQTFFKNSNWMKLFLIPDLAFIRSLIIAIESKYKLNL